LRSTDNIFAYREVGTLKPPTHFSWSFALAAASALFPQTALVYHEACTGLSFHIEQLEMGTNQL